MDGLDELNGLLRGAGSHIAVRQLSVRDELEIQQVFQACNDYFQIVDGRDARETEASEFLGPVPVANKQEDRFSLGLVDRRAKLIGLLDGLDGYPAASVSWIGLFMIVPQDRGQGIGRQFMQCWERFRKAQSVAEIRLGVVDENVAAQGFWESQGYAALTRTEPRIFGNKIQVVNVLHKVL